MPGISVLVPTFGRTRLLAEVVECYLRQDWGGDSELVILNDLGAQYLSCGVYAGPHRAIRITNLAHRLPTLGDKRNTLLASARYPVVTYWDDDDIYLPWRLSLGYELLHTPARRMAVREPTEWRMLPDGTLRHKGTRPFGTVTCYAEALRAVGGFPPLERLQDCAAVVEMVKAGHFNNTPICGRRPSTIYRLSAGVTATQVTKAPAGASQSAIRDYMIDGAAIAIRCGEERSGNINIVPAWHTDYVALAAKTPLELSL